MLSLVLASCGAECGRAGGLLGPHFSRPPAALLASTSGPCLPASDSDSSPLASQRKGLHLGFLPHLLVPAAIRAPVALVTTQTVLRVRGSSGGGFRGPACWGGVGVTRYDSAA